MENYGFTLYTQDERTKQANNNIKRWSKVNTPDDLFAIVRQAWRDTRSPAKKQVYRDWLMKQGVIDVASDLIGSFDLRAHDQGFPYKENTQ